MQNIALRYRKETGKQLGYHIFETETEEELQEKIDNLTQTFRDSSLVVYTDLTPFFNRE